MRDEIRNDIPFANIANGFKVGNYHDVAIGYSLPPVIPFHYGSKAGKDYKTAEEEQEAKDNDTIAESSLLIECSTFNTQIYFKVEDDPDDTRFQLRCDPVISVAQSNIIVRRNVCKSIYDGSIKERWSKDDYSVNIGGVLFDSESWPLEEQIQNLRDLCDASKAIEVKEDKLNEVWGITKIVITGIDFPVSKTGCQQFTIKAFSDSSYSLLVKKGSDV